MFMFMMLVDLVTLAPARDQVIDHFVMRELRTREMGEGVWTRHLLRLSREAIWGRNRMVDPAPDVSLYPNGGLQKEAGLESGLTVYELTPDPFCPVTELRVGSWNHDL